MPSIASSDAPRRADRSVGVRVREEHGELVAAETRREIRGRGPRPAGALANLDEQLVARRVAPGVVDELEAVEVEVEDRAVDSLRSERCSTASAGGRLGRPVRASWYAWWRSCSWSSRDLGERMLEPAVLEQDARVAGEGLEEREVVVVEGAHVAGAVADDEQTEARSSPRSGADDRVLEAARAQEAVETAARRRVEEHRATAVAADRAMRNCILRRERLRDASASRPPRRWRCAARPPARRAAGAGSPRTRPEQAPGGDEQLADREAELRRALRRRIDS